MIFGEVPPPSESRELLAWWSDILGVLGFFVSVAGFAVAVIVRQQVRQARKEAVNAIALYLRQQTLRDLTSLHQTVLLARDACRSKQWQRAHGYFDAAIEWMTRMVSDQQISVEERGELPAVLHQLRWLAGIVSNRKVDKNLATDRHAALDRIIAKVVNLETSARQNQGKVIS